MSGNWDKRKTIPRKRPERKPVVREISNGDDDVIITRLGDDSVRWIKTRRPRNSDLKVALSIYEEKQVIYNLLTNAIKFSPNNNEINIIIEDVTIQGGIKNGIPGVKVSIVDSGVGIPEDEIEIVFDKFIQSSKTKTHAGGTGLGLAICKEVISGHYGKIEAKLNFDQGTTFSFVIPRSQDTGSY